MAENEMTAKRALPERVSSMAGLGVNSVLHRKARRRNWFAVVAKWRAALVKIVFATGAYCPRVRLVLGVVSDIGESLRGHPVSEIELRRRLPQPAPSPCQMRSDGLIR